MELIEGITLKQYMEQKGTLNWREALHFSTQICKALEHAHSRGIVHRDIKPRNIMILKAHGSVKVADFGIARVSSAQNTLTRGGALGSVRYISPEQAKGAQVDCRADLLFPRHCHVRNADGPARRRMTVIRRCPLPSSISTDTPPCRVS